MRQEGGLQCRQLAVCDPLDGPHSAILRARHRHEAIVHGAVKRVRPKLMTVAAAMMGLMPIMWSIGTGADVMKRVAAPMVGGLATSFLMELLVYPAIYLLWKWHSEVKGESLQA